MGKLSLFGEMPHLYDMHTVYKGSTKLLWESYTLIGLVLAILSCSVLLRRSDVQEERALLLTKNQREGCDCYQQIKQIPPVR